MGAVLPARLSLPDKLDIGFINKGSGLQSVSRTLAAHISAGDPVQLLLNQGHQFFMRAPVAITPGDE
jgi:hypothetical protein